MIRIITKGERELRQKFDVGRRVKLEKKNRSLMYERWTIKKDVINVTILASDVCKVQIGDELRERRNEWNGGRFWPRMKKRKVNDCSFGKIMSMELRTWLYRRRNVPIVVKFGGRHFHEGSQRFFFF